MSILIVTGTGTAVGKTVVTAALAALAIRRGARLAVVKPAQTGVAPREPGDLDDVARLSGATDLSEYARYPDPLAPATAARRAGLPALDLEGTAARLAELRDHRDLVLVEGAGGLLVRFDEDGWTLADLARALSAPLLVVTAAGLGTLNHTALTLEVMAGRGLRLGGLVVGSYPVDPGLAERCNLTDLSRLAGRPLDGVLPEGAGALDPTTFRARAGHWLAPTLGGCLDVRDLLENDPMSPGSGRLETYAAGPFPQRDRDVPTEPDTPPGE